MIYFPFNYVQENELGANSAKQSKKPLQTFTSQNPDVSFCVFSPLQKKESSFLPVASYPNQTAKRERSKYTKRPKEMRIAYSALSVK